jgi:transcriptional regulator with XRE-family HTH domain
LKNLRDVLRSWRLHREYSVREAAKRIGLTASTYSRFEAGKADLTGDNLQKILMWMTRP